MNIPESMIRVRVRGQSDDPNFVLWTAQYSPANAIITRSLEMLMQDAVCRYYDPNLNIRHIQLSSIALALNGYGYEDGALARISVGHIISWGTYAMVQIREDVLTLLSTATRQPIIHTPEQRSKLRHTYTPSSEPALNNNGARGLNMYDNYGHRVLF